MHDSTTSIAMRFESESGCLEWCIQHRYQVKKLPTGRSAPRTDDLAFVDMRFEADAGRRIALSKHVLKSYEKPVLIWVTDWGIWPSSEHMPLFARFRQALGESRSIAEAPGYVADPRNDDTLSLLSIAVLFLWDVYVLPEEQGHIFFSSHDEDVRLFSTSSESAHVRRAFKDWI
jgi:hypothetical protein